MPTASVSVGASDSKMSNRQFQFQMKMTLPATVKKSGKWYVSCCPVLDVSSQGEDADTALANLVDALVGFFVSCFERGTLEQVLREAGFHPSSDAPRFMRMPENTIPIEVPIPFFVRSAARECRA